MGSLPAKSGTPVLMGRLSSLIIHVLMTGRPNLVYGHLLVDYLFIVYEHS